MRRTKTALVYLAVAALFAIGGALGGWYLFLHGRASSTAATDAARNLGVESPTFSGAIGSTAANAGGTSSGTANTAPTKTPQRLWQVDHAPVAGMAFGLATSSAAPDLYFVERGNGYLFDADPRGQSVRRLTNTLTPRIYEALFVPGQYGVLLRSLDTTGAITTYAGAFASSTRATSTAPQSLTLRELAKNIRAIVADPKSGALFYLTDDPAAFGVVGTSVGWSGAKPKQSFNSPVTSWRPQLAGAQVVLTESPADNMAGYSYTLGSSGVLTPLLGPIAGLEVLPHPSEKALLYSSSSGGQLTLFAQIGTKQGASLPIHTLAEKCVWAPGKSLILYCAVPSALPSAHFLDDWYQGLVHTSDTWWQIDTAAGTAQVLFNSSHALDVQKPTIDSSGNYIAFINSSDQSLWMLRIAQ